MSLSPSILFFQYVFHYFCCSSIFITRKWLASSMHHRANDDTTHHLTVISLLQFLFILIWGSFLNTNDPIFLWSFRYIAFKHDNLTINSTFHLSSSQHLDFGSNTHGLLYCLKSVYSFFKFLVCPTLSEELRIKAIQLLIY